MMQLGARVNLIVCQKSKVQDWIDHIFDNYADVIVYNGTKAECLKRFFAYPYDSKQVLVINYDLLWRRPELLKLRDFTLLLDESSLIQNETAKRSKFILKMQPKNVILLSGTPTGGKYERLWSQMKLLGWGISKSLYWQQYVKVEYLDLMGNRSIPIVVGYKNVDRLKRKMAEYGCQFLKTDEVVTLPQQNYQTISVPATPEYRHFHKNDIVKVDGVELVGDTILTKMLYERQLCGQFCTDKLNAFDDLLDSTDDRLVVFYSFNAELERLAERAQNHSRPVSVINGANKDMTAFAHENAVLLVQYQAGAMGLNLQQANKIIYFTPPLSCEHWMQSQKRIHRIGQSRPCFYYKLICKDSVEERIYRALERGVDFTEKLFEKGE